MSDILPPQAIVHELAGLIQLFQRVRITSSDRQFIESLEKVIDLLDFASEEFVNILASAKDIVNRTRDPPTDKELVVHLDTVDRIVEWANKLVKSMPVIFAVTIHSLSVTPQQGAYHQLMEGGIEAINSMEGRAHTTLVHARKMALALRMRKGRRNVDIGDILHIHATMIVRTLEHDPRY